MIWQPHTSRLVRRVWSLPDLPPVKDWNLPFKHPKRGSVISKRTVPRYSEKAYTSGGDRGAPGSRAGSGTRPPGHLRHPTKPTHQPTNPALDVSLSWTPGPETAAPASALRAHTQAHANPICYGKREGRLDRPGRAGPDCNFRSSGSSRRPTPCTLQIPAARTAVNGCENVWQRSYLATGGEVIFVRPCMSQS